MNGSTLAAITGSALLLFLSAPLQGQERQRMRMHQDSSRMEMMGPRGQMGGGPMMGHGGMMGMMGGSPSMMMSRPGALLRMARPLQLTAEQKSRIEEIQATAEETHGEHMEAAHAAHEEAREMLEGDAPDLAAYEEKLQSAMSEMARAHASMVRASVEARDVLTVDQRAKLRTAAEMMKAMREAPKHGPMHRKQGPGHSGPEGGGGMR